MGRLRHPHPSLPLKGEGIEGRGQGVALFMRRSVAVSRKPMALSRALVYGLYGLAEDEIRIVGGEA
jgi:hypothetical protein